MTGPKLENALQGLQRAINELDKTIMDTADKVRAQETGLTTATNADSVLPVDSLRAELNALRQMIQQANALIDGTADANTLSASDEVVH
jgi:prefoldin subunit 5